MKFGKYLDRDHGDLGAVAINEALRDSALNPENIQSVRCANSGWGYYNGQKN